MKYGLYALFIFIFLLFSCSSPLNDDGPKWYEGKWRAKNGCSPTNLNRIWIRDSTITVIKRSEIFEDTLELKCHFRPSSYDNRIIAIINNVTGYKECWIDFYPGGITFESTSLIKDDSLSFPSQLPIDSIKTISDSVWNRFWNNYFPLYSVVYDFPHSFRRDISFSPACTLSELLNVSGNEYYHYKDLKDLGGNVISSIRIFGHAYTVSDTLFLFPYYYQDSSHLIDYLYDKCNYASDTLLTLSDWPVIWKWKIVNTDSICIFPVFRMGVDSSGTHLYSSNEDSITFHVTYR